MNTIPIRTIHLFNNAINFLVSQCGATAVFCTATQPILDKVDKDKGAATFSYNPEMMSNVATIFNDLRRVDVTDARKNGGWGDGEIVAQVVEEAKACGSVLVINPADENLDKLRDIRIAKEKAERVLDEFKKSPTTFDGDLIGPKATALYYKYYYFDRADEMVYPVDAGKIGHDDNLLSLLSSNYFSVKAFKQANKKAPTLMLRQSFKSAAEAFEAIDAPTESVIKYFGETKMVV